MSSVNVSYTVYIRGMIIKYLINKLPFTFIFKKIMDFDVIYPVFFSFKRHFKTIAS